MGIEIGFLSVVRFFSHHLYLPLSSFVGPPSVDVVLGMVIKEDCTPTIGGNEVDLSLSRAIERDATPLDKKRIKLITSDQT